MLHPLTDPGHVHQEAEMQLGEGFTNPFRYIPHILVKEAAGRILEMIEGWKSLPDGSPLRELERSFAEGKMLGVMIVTPKSSTRSMELMRENLHYIAAFSGTVRGADGLATATVEGFVPPIIDLTLPDGHFKKEEARISQLSMKIAGLSESPRLHNLKNDLNEARRQRDAEIDKMQSMIRFSKMQRDEIRQEVADPNVWNELIKQSQFQKAELKRLKDRWNSRIESISSEISKMEEEILRLKSQRSQMSDNLQKWIFENAVVHNATGESATIWSIFENSGLTPPGGTGDCAAPKLLEYAFRHGLEPLAMGEFWYGRSPETAVRTHGHFYPSCTSKCGPLLGYMMQGSGHHVRTAVTEPSLPNPIAMPHQSGTAAEVEKTADREQRIISNKSMEGSFKQSVLNSDLPVIIHEDESVIVVEKPSGMPSVPGLDGRLSLQEWLIAGRESLFTEQNDRASDQEPDSKREVHSVHRLDMDTSGVMIFAKTRDAAIKLRRQFEEHTVRKTYMARVLPLHTQTLPKDNARTSIELPLSPDYDERPRQKVDFKQGKKAHTEYEIRQEHADGTADLLLYPHTGRTHQLRVHCAHTLGLGRPIVGDLLYGAHTAKGCSATDGCSVTSTSKHTGAGSAQHPQAGSAQRLCLHALSITFRHPDTDEPLTFTSSHLSY